MQSDFPAMLRAALAKAGMSQMDLARALGTVSSVVSHTCKGEKLPPLERITHWAKALNLRDEACADFIRQAHLAHCPEVIRDDYLRLRARVDKLDRRVAEFEEKYKA